MSYVRFRRELAPPALRGKQGAAWDIDLGHAEDETANRARDAVASGMPGTAPDDSLVIAGMERGIERGYSETLASYRERLRTAHQVWTRTGTPLGMLQAIEALGFTGAYLMTPLGKEHFIHIYTGGLLTAPLASGSWLLSAYPAYWSGFVVYFNSDPGCFAPQAEVSFSGSGLAGNFLFESFQGICTERTWCLEVVSGTNLSTGVVFKCSYDGGATWFPNSPSITSGAGGLVLQDIFGSTGLPFDDGMGNFTFYLGEGGGYVPGDRWTTKITDPRAAQLRRTIAKWKPGYAKCEGIFVRFSGESWGWEPSNADRDSHLYGTWGEPEAIPPGTWGGSVVVRY